MSKSAKSLVPAAAVRAWGRDNLDLIPAEGHKCLGETARGRLHPTVVEAYGKANKSAEYVPNSAAEAPTVTFKAVGLNSKGGKTTREVTITTAEARELIGGSGKGRLPMGEVVAAYEATIANDAAEDFDTAAA